MTRRALETQLLRKVLLMAPEHGFRLSRNNTGQYRTDQGHVIRYGCFNPGGADMLG